MSGLHLMHEKMIILAPPMLYPPLFRYLRVMPPEWKIAMRFDGKVY
jgi:hypothetical protein